MPTKALYIVVETWDTQKDKYNLKCKIRHMVWGKSKSFGESING